MKLSEFEEQLELSKRSDHFSIYINSSITELRDSVLDSKDCIKAILHFMENNPNVDFGSPGSLVKYLEEFVGKGYEEELIESVKRRPTTHTVWMLNRAINGIADLQLRENCVELLATISKNDSIEQGLRELAEEFYEFQTEQ